jgi:lysine-specific permease
MYASTRMLYSMAMEKKAPKIFAKVNKGGVPIVALIATTIVGMACFLGSMAGNATVYLWLVNASAVAGFIAWLGIAISHYKFRKAFVAQGHNLSELKYKALLFPFGPIFALLLCLVIIIGQFFVYGDPAHPILAFLTNYIGAIAFIVLYFAYKFIKKTKLVKAEDADLSQGFAKEL